VALLQRAFQAQAALHRHGIIRIAPMPSNESRPSIAIIATFAVIAALQVFNLVTRNDVLTAVLTLLVCAAYIAWFFWSRRYR
jgi:hypothetical protein